MKTLVKTAALVALVFGAVTSANAQTYPNPTTNPDGGALIVSIWDDSVGSSIVYALPGLFYQQVADGLAPIAPFVVPDFSTVFGGSDPANIRYTVAASGIANSAGALFTTGPDAVSGVLNGDVAATSLNAANFYGQLDAECGAATPCNAIANPAAGQYAGQSSWGDLTIQLPFSAAGGVGESLAFWDLSQVGDRRIRPSDPASVTAYAGGLGIWLLDSEGLLSYDIVPVPAAVWLLVSGLIGFGAISRRRETAAA